jgi:hypothetical protein
MKCSSLRSWIITIIVMIFVYLLYTSLGTSLSTLAKHTGTELSTWQVGYRYGNLLVYSVILIGWLMSGITLFKGDRENKLALYSGGALIAYSGLCLLWQVLAILNLSLHINLTPRPVFATLTIVSALLMYASLILLAMYYRYRPLRNLAITYTAVHVVSTTLYVWLQFLPPVRHLYLNSAYALVGSAALIIQIIYLFKWAKLLKNQEQ